MMTTKDKELVNLKRSEKTFEDRLNKIQNQNDKEKNIWQKKLEKEIDMKT